MASLTCKGKGLIFLALQLSTSFGLFSNYLPFFSTLKHLSPILNLHFSQILSLHPPILTSIYRSSLPQLVSTLLLFSPSSHYPFVQYAQTTLFFVLSYICIFDYQIYFLISSYSPNPILTFSMRLYLFLITFLSNTL